MKAFPNEFESSGMDLRDYFAAHAPIEPQSWFVPNMTGVKEAGYIESITKIKNSDLPDEEKHAAVVEQQRRRNVYKEQLFKQWPYAWADAMMEERKKMTKNEKQTIS